MRFGTNPSGILVFCSLFFTLLHYVYIMFSYPVSELTESLNFCKEEIADIRRDAYNLKENHLKNEALFNHGIDEID